MVALSEGVPLVRHDLVTCMEVLKKNLDEPDACSMLVVGTEGGQVHILDPSGKAVAETHTLPSTPAFLATAGLKAVEYRIAAACRDGRIYTVKDGAVLPGAIEAGATPCGMLRLGGGLDSQLVVSTLASTVHAYQPKGKRSYSIRLPEPATCLEALELRRTRSAKALLLGLASGELRLYSERHLVATLRLGEPITAMRFGSYGREEGSLLAVSASGALTVKMLQRKASLEAGESREAPPEQDVPLSVPKKTRLYIEQTQREREQAVEMHRAFQRDLCQLRLSTARAYVKLARSGRGPLSSAPGAKLRLAAQVRGMGPLFRIRLSLHNTGEDPVADVVVAFSLNPAVYRVRQPLLKLPALVPGVPVQLDGDVDCLQPAAGPGSVRVFVSSARSTLPLLSALVKLPAAQGGLLEG